MSIRDLAYFDSLVDRSGDCWIWTGTIRSDGYGRYGGSGAHRLAYERWVGPIPAGLEIDHHCRKPACVNLAHLEPVTRAENMRRRVQAKTGCGNGHPWDDANTYQRPDGRQCRACNREQARVYRERMRGDRGPATEGTA